MILCIDDEPTGLLIRKAVLECQGYRVLTATSGPEGLELFAANPVQAVVLDYAMPGMDGGKVAAEMKRRDPNVKILMYSAYVDLPAQAVACVDAQGVKGMPPDAFVAEIHKLLHR